MAGKNRKKTRCVHVNAGRGYDVLIREGILADAGEETVKVCPKAVKAAVVCDGNVFLPHAEPVECDLADAGLSCAQYLLTPGEQNKNIGQYAQILSFLAEQHLTRDDVLVALGGGVTGDMAGFAAATYLRGIRYVQVPTTLLAMVDSSVGGKTAVDLPAGKNLAGAFCQPALVLCDPLALKTLPDDIFRDGCAEVLKYGVLYDRQFFLKLKDLAESRTSGQSLKQALARHLEEIIETCVAWKRDVVEQDEFDRGERKKLNLGHTFGHAVEACSDFAVSHGQAVAIGMAMMARTAVRKGYMDEAEARLLEETLQSYGLPTATDYAAADLAKAAASDKKASQRAIDLVVPRAIGCCELVRIELADLQNWIEEGLSW
ncbi:MAG: 3-dehydroquinate synthase [Firmicutes bacterium]|nr:3-dehydroquinate synthase [Bacillota bacterium]